MSSNIIKSSPSTLIDILRLRAFSQPTQPAFTFLVNGETESITVTYAELDRQARTIGGLLQRMVPVGGRALLLYRPGPEYIAAFFGCLYAGVVAIPAYPPQSARPERPLARRLRAIAIDCQVSVVLTQTSFLQAFQKLSEQIEDLKNIPNLATDALSQEYAASWQPPDITDTSLAVLQIYVGIYFRCQRCYAHQWQSSTQCFITSTVFCPYSGQQRGSMASTIS